MAKATAETGYLLHLAVAIVLIAVALAILQRYVASLISLGAAVVIISLLGDKKCKE